MPGTYAVVHVCVCVCVWLCGCAHVGTCLYGIVAQWYVVPDRPVLTVRPCLRSCHMCRPQPHSLPPLYNIS